MTTLVVDGSNITMRAIYASQGKGVGLSANVAGIDVDTAGLLLAINLLSKYVRQVNPDRLAVCFDSGTSEFRLRVDPNYKSARLSKSAEAMDTFDLFRQFLTLSNITNLSIPGVEADDLVAGYVYKASMLGSTVILSGDKDFLQLLTANGNAAPISQIRPGLTPETWTANTVIDKMGVTPKQLAKVMALTGDKTDGIPGVPRVGEKTAIKILKEYDWNLDAVGGHKLVAAHMDRVRTNSELVDLSKGPWADLQDFLHLDEFTPLYSEALIEWLGRFDMASVAGRVLSGTLWGTQTLFPA